MDPSPPLPAGPQGRESDWEPVARWENEGGAYAEQDPIVRAAGGVASAQDGDATRRE